MLIEHVDQLHLNGRHKDIYEELQKLTGKETEPEVLWRLARSCYFMAYPLEMKNPKKKALLDEALSYASLAYELDGDAFEIIKCLAAVTGARTDFLGTREKIEQGNNFKELLDKALAMDPMEYTLLHMRGRFAFSVAGLSWLERKAATAFYSKPPEASYDDAIKDFLAVVDLKPDWLDNLLFLGKAYLAKGEKKNALEHFRKAIDSYQQDENEEEPEMLNEAKALLKKHGK